MQALAELRTLIARHADTGGAQRVVHGVGVAAFTSANTPVYSMYEPLFAIIAGGAKTIVLGDDAFECREGDAMVVPLDLPVASHIRRASEDAPYFAVAMPLRPQLVASLLLEGAPAVRESDTAPGIGIFPAPDDLLDAMIRLLRVFDRPSDIPILQPMIEREIVWRLLCGERGSVVRDIGLTDSRLSKISEAVRWIREHYADSLRIEALAERVSMSATSFHRHFRAATSMSPLQYQKHIRLHEARSRLMTRAEDVASVGFSVGYESPSQFSREYSRLFGAPPGRDAEELRAALSS